MLLKQVALLFAVIAAGCLGAPTAHAGNFRTWVSGTGTNTGPCSRTAPCQTFAYAIGQTNSSGEINCLSPGSFGAVTISISVTIDCESVSNGGITVGSGTGITINTASTVVNLIGLDINGDNGGGDFGVQITAAAVVNIRNCKIYDFFSGEAIQLTSGTLVVDKTFVADSFYGISQDVTSGGAIANMSVRNSNFSNNGYGIQVQVNGGSHAGATIEQTTLAFNHDDGLYVFGSGAVAIIGGSTLVNNGTGVAALSGGTVYSFKNNQIGGNNTDGTPLTAYPGGPLN